MTGDLMDPTLTAAVVATAERDFLAAAERAAEDADRAKAIGLSCMPSGHNMRRMVEAYRRLKAVRPAGARDDQ